VYSAGKYQADKIYKNIAP